MARYIDGYVLPVPKKNVERYRRIAALAAKVWRDHGALDYRECVAEDLAVHEGCGMRFDRLAKLKPGETVVFAYIVYKSRAHRDRVNAKVMKDPRMNAVPGGLQGLPFDYKRMAFAGFKTLVGS